MILLDLAAKATVLMALGALCVFAVRQASAASRHTVRTTMFVALLLLPLARVVMPEWAVLDMPDRFSPAAAPQSAGQIASASPVKDGLQVRPATAARSGLVTMDLPGALAATWLLGIALRLIWIASGVVGTRRLEALAHPMADERVRDRARQVAEWLGVRRSIRLLAVSKDVMPVTWGLRTPRVLLPEVARTWSDARLDAVLTHELSHVVRNDAWSHLVARVAITVWWWHPMAWLAARAARLDRERACDDLVLTTGTRASDYATDLVTFVSSLQPPVSDSPALLAMARRSQLEGRVMAILENGVNRRGVSQAGILAAMLVMVLVWPLAAARPVVQEDQDPIRVGGQIKEPRKIKDVRPMYPGAAIAEGRQGMVIVEAVIGADGNVASARVIRSIGEDLDAAAVDAVTQWRFTPTTLNGVLVPVIMTVTVSFRLDADGNPMAPPPQVAGAANGVQGGLAGGVAGGVVSDDRPLPTWAPGDPPLRVGGAIKEPKKIRDVRPVYPEIAQQSRVTGIVILEIQINEDGKVTAAKVLRPVALLDQAAQDAVMQWEFMPTMLNGQAVPIIMTVTVTFSIEL